MLDFYLINDNQPNPSFPEQVSLKIIVGLDLKTFKNLQNKGFIDLEFNYFSNFRWNFNTIKRLKTKVDNMNSLDTDLKKINLILEQALKANSGIIAFCD